MPQLFVNDIFHPIESSSITWGELLANLDEEISGQGHLLTSARFDGVDEPSFRQPEVTARRLNEVVRVDIETAPPAAFLRLCLIETIRPLEEAALLAAHLSVVYRRQDVTPGHDGLTALAGELRGLTALVAMLSGPLNVDVHAVTDGGVNLPQLMEEFGIAIDALVAAQESQDWLTVADVLEYDIEPSVRRWIELLTFVANRL